MNTAVPASAETALPTLQTSAQTIAFPLFGAGAIVLAANGERLGIATMLVGIPILSNLFNALAFLIGVTIYGF